MESKKISLTPIIGAYLKLKEVDPQNTLLNFMDSDQKFFELCPKLSNNDSGVTAQIVNKTYYRALIKELKKHEILRV